MSHESGQTDNESKWNILTVINTNMEYKITQFDDGLNKYETYVNKWHIYGTWRGKVALVNSIDSSVCIPSISFWKSLNYLYFVDLIC